MIQSPQEPLDLDLIDHNAKVYAYSSSAETRALVAEMRRLLATRVEASRLDEAHERIRSLEQAIRTVWTDSALYAGLKLEQRKTHDLQADLDQALTAIEAAPHTTMCRSVDAFGRHPGPCNCWKANTPTRRAPHEVPEALATDGSDGVVARVAEAVFERTGSVSWVEAQRDAREQFLADAEVAVATVLEALAVGAHA